MKQYYYQEDLLFKGTTEKSTRVCFNRNGYEFKKIKKTYRKSNDVFFFMFMFL